MQIGIEKAASEATVGPDSRPRQKDGLDISPADDGYIIYEPEQDRVHYLNATAVLILELCDGTNSAADMAELLREAYGLPAAPTGEVLSALAAMQQEELLVVEDRD